MFEHDLIVQTNYSLWRVVVNTTRQMIKNLPRTYEKVYSKVELYRFGSYRKSSVHTDAQKYILLLLVLYNKNFVVVLSKIKKHPSN